MEPVLAGSRAWPSASGPMGDGDVRRARLRRPSSSSVACARNGVVGGDLRQAADERRTCVDELRVVYLVRLPAPSHGVAKTLVPLVDVGDAGGPEESGVLKQLV